MSVCAAVEFATLDWTETTSSYAGLASNLLVAGGHIADVAKEELRRTYLPLSMYVI